METPVPADLEIVAFSVSLIQKNLDWLLAFPGRERCFSQSHEEAFGEVHFFPIWTLGKNIMHIFDNQTLFFLIILIRVFNYFRDNKVASGIDTGDFLQISQVNLSRDFCEHLIYF